MKRPKPTRLPAPFLQRLSLKEPIGDRSETYPFNLPFLRDPDWELHFTKPVTVLVGENGTGKSTLIEAIGAIAGYDEASGGKGHRAVDHSSAVDVSGAALQDVFRAGWLPKVTNGWFFRAESFFAVARYLDESAMAAGAAPPDFLSWSHGEGFLRFFAERCTRQGIYLLDEPESALSPARQMDLLAILAGIQETAVSQVIMATHSPLLMALPGATVLQMTRFGLEEVDYRRTRHFRLYQEFTTDPVTFVADALAELRAKADDDGL